MTNGLIVSGIALIFNGLIVFGAIIYSIKNYKTNKEKNLLIAEQFDKTLKLLRQPLSKTSALQSACLPPLSDHSESIECQQLKSFFQNRTVFFGS